MGGESLISCSRHHGSASFNCSSYRGLRGFAQKNNYLPKGRREPWKIMSTKS